MSKSNSNSSVGVVKNSEVKTLVQERILSVLKRNKNGWEGTMTELLSRISNVRKQPEVWPGSASSLSRIVSSLTRSIQRAGYKVEFSRTPDRERMRLVRFMPIAK